MSETGVGEGSWQMQAGERLGKGARRWNGYFGAEDMAAVAHLMQVWDGMQMSDAVRKAIALQVERDRCVTVPRKLAAIYKAAVPYDAKKQDGAEQSRCRHRSSDDEAMVRRFIWLSDEELSCLREIASAHGLRGYSEAVRLSLRVQAVLEGYREG